MRYQLCPEDFVVQERIHLPLDSAGDLAIYRVEKRGVTTRQVQRHIAAQLGRRDADVQAPALKDKQAVAVQYVWLRGTGPAELRGPGYTARFVGRSRRPLRPTDLLGNRFTVRLRDLSPGDAQAITTHLHTLAHHGLPNYYDHQRFGSYTAHPQAPTPFIGKTILLRDAEGAVWTYLACPFAGDPRPVKAFKAQARRRWGVWPELLDIAPRPSNYRSLLTFLQDHPRDFRRALNLIPRRLLSLYLVAYQSYLWNRIAGAYLAHHLALDSDGPHLTILDRALPIYRRLAPPQRAQLGKTNIPLPHHRATFSDAALERIAHAVLAEEGLSLNELKARILKRAYLPKGQRPLLLFPTEIAVQAPQQDDRFPGRQQMQVSFTLPRGAFATLVLRRLAYGLEAGWSTDDPQSVE